MILTGCNATADRAIKAAVVKAEADAGTTLPDQPERCRKHMGRAIPKLTESPRMTQLRWEFAADAIDAQIDDCAGFYDTTKREFSKGQPQ